MKGLGKGRTILFDTETSYDWANNQRTIPFNLGYSKVSRMGHQLVSNYIGLKVYTYTHFDNGPDWGGALHVYPAVSKKIGFNVFEPFEKPGQLRAGCSRCFHSKPFSKMTRFLKFTHTPAG